MELQPGPPCVWAWGARGGAGVRERGVRERKGRNDARGGVSWMASSFVFQEYYSARDY